MNIIEEYMKANWMDISGTNVLPDKFAVLKLGGQSSSKSPLNLSVFTGGERPRYLIKMNRGAADFKAIEDEFKNLKRIGVSLRQACGCLLPEAVHFAKIDGFTLILVETFLPGKKVSLANFSELSLLFSKAFGWLKEFYLITRKGKADIGFQDVVLPFAAPERLKRKLEIISNKLCARGDLEIPISSCQGDFDFDNILLSKNNIAIVDWEDYAEAKSPFFDAEFFVFNAAMYYYKEDGHIKSLEKYFLKSSKTYKLADTCISDYCKFLGVDKSMFYIVSILDTINMIACGHGRHRCVPMQSMDFLEKLIDLTIRESGLTDV